MTFWAKIEPVHFHALHFNIILQYICVYVRMLPRAQSVQRLATGWTVEVLDFESRWGQDFSLIHAVETGSGVPPTSHPMGTGGFSPGGKAAGALN
jgi:hypothetical protein